MKIKPGIFNMLCLTNFKTFQLGRLYYNWVVFRGKKEPGQIFRIHSLGEIHGKVQELHHSTGMKITKLVPLPILNLWANSICLLLEDSFVPKLHQQLEWEKFESMVLLLGLLIFILRTIKQENKYFLGV